MGNQPIDFPQQLREQWQQISLNHRTLLENKCTSEVFLYRILSKGHEYSKAQLIERSIYSSSKTPKIIILSKQEGQLVILQQEFNYSIKEHIPTMLLPTDLLALLSEMTVLFSYLYKKYGSFHVSQNMVGFNKHFDIIGWINSQKHKNTPEFPFENNKTAEQTMIEEILLIVQKYTAIQLERMVHRPFCRSFEQFDCFLNRQLQKRKYQISALVKTSEKCIVRALSPQNTIGPLRMGMTSKLPARGGGGQHKSDKTLLIPRFIQKNKDKSRLENINHRRTTTMEESQLSMILNPGRFEKSKSNYISKQQKSVEKSVGKLKSVRTTSNTNKVNNLSFGSICKGINPQLGLRDKAAEERLTYSGYLSHKGKGKQFPADLRFIKSCNNVQSILTQTRKTVDDSPNTPSSLKTPKPLHGFSRLRREYSLEVENCLFQPDQRVFTCSSQVVTPLLEGRLQQLPVSNTESKYLSEMKKTEVIIEEESHLNASKTLEDEFNDFFSNPSKSPRFMLGPLRESVDLERQFQRIIDM